MFADVRPECEEQNNRIVEWVGGETKALELLESRMKHEEKVCLIQVNCKSVKANNI
jgi:hypothetical protein